MRIRGSKRPPVSTAEHSSGGRCATVATTERRHDHGSRARADSVARRVARTAGVVALGTLGGLVLVLAAALSLYVVLAVLGTASVVR